MVYRIDTALRTTLKYSDHFAINQIEMSQNL